MTEFSAPAGATGSACLSDLITIDRGYLDSIVALLRDPTRTRGPGLTEIVDSFEQAIADAKIEARDDSRPVQIDLFIEWDDGGCSNFQGDADEFAALLKSLEVEGRSLL